MAIFSQKTILAKNSLPLGHFLTDTEPKIDSEQTGDRLPSRKVKKWPKKDPKNLRPKGGKKRPRVSTIFAKNQNHLSSQEKSP